MKRLALSLLILLPLHGGAPKQPTPKVATSRFPLPLPKSYKMPPEIQDIVLYLYRHADSVADFKDRYKLVYEDKAELIAFIKPPLWVEGQDTLILYMRDDSFKDKKERLGKMAKDLTAWEKE